MELLATLHLQCGWVYKSFHMHRHLQLATPLTNVPFFLLLLLLPSLSLSLSIYIYIADSPSVEPANLTEKWVFFFLRSPSLPFFFAPDLLLLLLLLLLSFSVVNRKPRSLCSGKTR